MFCQGGNVILVQNILPMLELSYALYYFVFVISAVFDIVRYSRSKDVSAMVNLIACSGGVVLLTLDLCLKQGDVSAMAFVDLISVELAVILSFGSSASQRPHIMPAMTYLSLCVIFAFFSAFFPKLSSIRYVIVCTVALVCCVAGVWTSFTMKYKKPKPLFAIDSLMKGIELDFRVLSSCVFLALVALYCLFSPMDNFAAGIMVNLVALLMLALFLGISVNTSPWRRLMISKGVERKLMEKAGSSEKPHKSEEEAERERNLGLYSRIMARMEKHKPFLDPDFTIDDLSKSIYTNKLYVSRAINSVSKMNFCQFVNHHRIEYAKSLFRENPALKVMETSEMSGFHTVASFNMAFKLNTGLTPSEWIKKNVLDVV